MAIELYEIKRAIRIYELYRFSVGGFNANGRIDTSNFAAKFEDIICDYIQAVEELKEVRNLNKRACVYYDAIGYNQDNIAYELHISQQAVSKNLKWLKNFFTKMVVKNGR